MGARVMARFGIDDIGRLLDIPADKVLSLDIETTGLDATHDEVLQVAIVDGNFKTVLDRLFRPVNHVTWDNAERIHGIAPDEVQDKNPLRGHAEEIQAALSGACLLVGFNLAFDFSFLSAAGVDAEDIPHFDVMEEFARMRGGQRRKWMPRSRTLEACARHYGIEYASHQALGDARVAMQCYQRMLHDNGSRFFRTGYGSVSTVYLAFWE